MADLNDIEFTNEMLTHIKEKLNIKNANIPFFIANDDKTLTAIVEKHTEKPYLVATWARTSTIKWHEIFGEKSNNIIFSKGRPKNAREGIAVAYIDPTGQTDGLKESQLLNKNNALENEIGTLKAKIENLENELAEKQSAQINTQGLSQVDVAEKDKLRRVSVAPEANVIIPALLNAGLSQSDVGKGIDITATQVRRLRKLPYRDYNSRKAINEKLFQFARELGIADD